jgi:HEAT repeats
MTSRRRAKKWHPVRAMGPMSRRVLALLLLWTWTAHADTSVPEGAGLKAVTAHVDPSYQALRYGTCAAPPCTLTDDVVMHAASAFDWPNVSMTPVEMSGGKHALWVHVPSTGPASWDAVLVGRAPALLYSEATGLSNGQPGSMSGHKVKVVPDGQGHSFIARGTASEDYSICGRDALAYPEVLDPQSLEWKRASFLQLSPTEVAEATSITATARAGTGLADKPLAPLLSARFASSGDHPAALADLDPSTVWTHASVGKGRGEFVTFNAPSDVPITRLTITIAPPKPPPTGAAPKTFFLATNDRVFAVTMPEDAWVRPSRGYDIALPEPIKSSCLALVLDDAFVKSQSATGGTEVSIAELTAYSELDVPGATLDSVASDLGAGSRRAEAAAATLKRAGDPALAPIGNAWPKLDVYGHELALDVAAAASCGSSASQVFLQGLCDADAHVARKAESALLQCKRSADIVAAVQASPNATCAKTPQLLALLGRERALPSLVSMLASARSADVATNIRHQVASAAREAPPKLLASLVSNAQYSPRVRLEILRAITPRLGELSSDATAALDAILGGTPDMATRYLALEPLAELAKSGDRASQGRVAAMLSKDADWPVRARAAELAKDLPSAQPELVSAIADAEPRVRQAALESVAALRVSAAAVLVEKRLTSDPWTFVRVASARALGAIPAAGDVDKALATILGTDASPQVRSAIIRSLATHQARTYIDAVRSRLDDAQELTDVRATAARALGTMCDPTQLERLSELARAAADPMASGEDIALGLAALEALGDLHPADLPSRLAKLRGKTVRDAVRAAAEHAIASQPKCGH